MSASRSLGLRHARGEYVALLDSDDVWLPDKLERQVAEFDSYPTAGMIYGTTEYWYSWTRLPDDRQRDVVPPTGFTTDTLVAPPALLVRFLRGETRSPGTCSVLLRREVMEAVGGFEERFRGMYEDQAFFAKVCLAVPVLVTNACAARYRQHPDSCYARARQTGEAQLAEISYLRWLARHVAHDAGGSGEAWRTLQAILWPYRHPLLHRLRKRGRWAALRLGLGRWQGGRAEGR